MSDAYSKLRDAVACLASSADSQSSHLDKLFAPIDGNKSKYRNCDELALGFDDAFLEGKGPAAKLLNENQKSLIEDLDNYLKSVSGQANWQFWERDALFTDDRWDHVRKLATRALDRLPPIK
jgi:hypothetical protein